MPAPATTITNLADLKARRAKGETLTALGKDAKPKAVDYRTLKAALERAEVVKAKAAPKAAARKPVAKKAGK